MKIESKVSKTEYKIQNLDPGTVVEAYGSIYLVSVLVPEGTRLLINLINGDARRVETNHSVTALSATLTLENYL